MKNKPNICITGDEARILMVIMMNSKISVPFQEAMAIYMNLSQINQAQPPVVVEKEESND